MQLFEIDGSQLTGNEEAVADWLDFIGAWQRAQ
jgi:hypothetical protein